MKEVSGYYDGNTVKLLEPAPKMKQKVIVTFIDDDSVLMNFRLVYYLNMPIRKKKILQHLVSLISWEN